jgi:hypothetical protein
MPNVPEVWAIQQVPRQPELQETRGEWGQRDTGVEREEGGSMHMHARAMDISCKLKIQPFSMFLKYRTQNSE